MIVGIDPGMSGAFALVDSYRLVAAVAMPGDGNGRISIPVAHNVLADWHRDFEVTACVVEDVHSMPKQGVSTTFKFGRAAGVAETLPTAFGWPTFLITPSEWKKHHRITRQGKDASRQLAIRMWPHLADTTFKRLGTGQAYADAALLAIAWEQNR